MAYIIAEAGVNHNGDVNIARELIRIAKRAGCDCVKFQVFSAEKIVTHTASKARYQVENTQSDDTQFNMLKKLELGFDDFKMLKAYCDENKIDFLATPFDEDAVDLLENLGVNAYKVSSGDITNKPLLQYIACKKKKILLSTGMSTLEEVSKAVQWINETGNNDIVLFHCTSNYPAAYSSVNMEAMNTLKKEFRYPVGYSDHTPGIEIPLMAVAYGAEVIEKHFTYDKTAEGPDHKASLNPEELEEMVRTIRNVEIAVGTGEKRPTDEEMETRKAARKSLVWKKDISAGTVVQIGDLCCKRPGDGIPPENMESMIGKVAVIDCKADTLVSWMDVK